MIINLSVPVTFGGKHYNGVSVYPGVNLSITPAPCGVPKNQLVFEGAAINPVIFVEGITSAQFDGDEPCKGYLRIYPV